MIKLVYARFDNCGKFFNLPQYSDIVDVNEFLEQNKRACCRVTDESQILYIKDITIYKLGTFDDVTCKFNLLPEPIKLIDCKDWFGGDSNVAKA